ncbi:hypothetical protein EHQ43_17640 [Leptospira bouyouniensis]|uniref:Uncharacterized protein n=1 Tax=Leptospira bouyouniensis TaxID=2484911 RepID=A0A7I0HN24_9LEPT|nr:hypothetical protein [Leptospira bouyouniensis]TGL02182.1 hypothetical protein EHQ43_17640 [Leptospira bouyouniensis]
MIKNKKLYIAAFFLLFVGNSDQTSSFGKLQFLSEYFRNKKINLCEFYYTEDELTLMDSEDKPFIDKNNIPNSLLLILNTFLLLGFIFSSYFCFILHEKAKLKLSSYSENITLLDYKENCFITKNFSSKNDILISTYIYCDENNNYTIDKITQTDSLGNIFSESFDNNEDGFDEINITNYPNNRGTTKCFYKDKSNFSEKCISSFSDGSKLETLYFYEGEVYEKSIFYDSTGSKVSEIENYGNKGFRLK